MESDIDVIPIKTPLLPFHLGNARVVKSKHTFLHFIEIPPLVKQLNNIERAYNILEKSLIFTHVHMEDTLISSANNLLIHAKYLIAELKIKLNNVRPHNRSKRGLLNFGGKISKWLFGTLDSDDGEKYDNAINELRHNQNSYKKEMGIQISLTKQLIDNYNSTITLLSQNQEIIKDQINAFEKNVSRSVSHLTTFLEVRNTLFQIILNCQSFVTFLDNLEDAIMFAKLNTLHSAVVSATDLEQMIFNLSTLYSDDNVLILKNINNYYQLAGLQVNFIQDKIIFAIHIPIFTKDMFEIFHLFPIPINHTIFIPELSYLILGTNLRQYQDEACPTVENLYICQNQLVPQTNDCTTNLIKKAENQNCQTVKVELSTQIIHSITNQYILAIPDDNKIKIQKNCRNKEIIFIEEPSIINIPLNCSIQIQDTQFWNKEEVIQGSPFSLPPITFSTHKSKEPEGTPLKLQTINLDKIKILQEQAKLLKIPKDDYEIHPITWSLTSSLVFLLIIIIIIIIAWKLYTKRLANPQRRKPDIPMEEIPENNPASLLFSSSAGGVM